MREIGALDVIGAILNQQPQPPAPETPAELERIIFKCLNKDLEARYPSARALAEVLIFLSGVFL